MSFDAIGLPQPLLQAVKSMGYKNLTPIQQKGISAIRSGQDVLASAQTGTGKTAAFSLPIIEALLKTGAGQGGQGTGVQALVLTPTRELAKQVKENIEQYCQNTQLTTTLVYGGVGNSEQQKRIQQGSDIVVATPGRVLELIQNRTLRLNQLKFVVLDEADRMLDMGFLKAIEEILSPIKQPHQTLLFSATFSNKVKNLAKQFLQHPRLIETAKQNATAKKVRQYVYPVQENRKREMLSELIGKNNWHQVMVFAGTRESANELAKELKLDGIKAVLCHGEKSQGARNKALQDFTEGKARVIVATDVAARGIDIADLHYVVNYHLPFLAEDYVHRIGRTGRAGKSGTAISLVSPKDHRFLGDIEALIEQKIERIVLPGYEFDLMTEIAKKDAAKKGVAKKDVSKVAPESKNRYQKTRDKNRSLDKKRSAAGKSKVQRKSRHSSR
ncbi:DEAD/DEAH box helicase [Thalassotalea litorea]|uniref:DEAD/DEAH box helicase n=1 Tax=Thalassotalea litorea TaxID=2020715 RepID=A0A5R9IK02_9GAMM|nr:DEAD/DEAH box helicase [Thalassotalea litorea]TLU61617.1 DEAD/DEAH box helicase [Thalassotalea litorea]